MSRFQIPRGLGAGSKSHALQRLDVPVNIATPADGSACVVYGASESPIGPMVLLGTVATIPGLLQPVALLGHLEPEEAIALASHLLEASATVEEMRRARAKQ